MEMETEIPLCCVALAALCRAAGMTRTLLKEKTGISRAQLARYLARAAPPEDRLHTILEALGCSRARFDAVLASLGGEEPPFPAATPVDPAPDERHEIRAVAAEMGRSAEKLAEGCLVELVRERKTREDRAAAEAICDWLERQEKRWLIVEKAREVQTWAVAEALAHRCVEAPEHAGRALELAGLACRVAELAPCDGPFRQSLLGQILFFRENVVRAGGDLSAADALWKNAERLWRLGAAAQGPLDAWRMPDFTGSLRRDQRRLDEAVEQLDLALAIAPAEAKGRILVNKATVLEQMGKFPQALALVTEAERIIDGRRDPRLFFIVRFNRATVLTLLGRFGEVRLLLPELRKLAKVLGLERYQIKVVWLASTVAAGLGAWTEAEAGLVTAHRELARRKEPWESALAGLQLGVLLCRLRRPREAGGVAAGLRWILTEEKLSREARAALQRFRDAAERSALTLELAEEILRSFQRAPKADLDDLDAAPPDHPHGQPGDRYELTAFAATASAGVENAAAPAGRGCDGAVATAAGVDPAAPIQGITVRCGGGSGPDLGQPGGEAIQETGMVQRGGRPGSRQRGRGKGGEDEERGEGTASDDASKHGFCSFRQQMRERTSFLPSIMVRRTDPNDLRVLARLLMAWRGWTQDEFAAASGLSTGTIGNYQNGKTKLTRAMVEPLVVGAGMPLLVVDFFLLPAIAAEREGAGRTGRDAVAAILERLAAQLQGLGRRLAGTALATGGGRPDTPDGEVPWPTAAEREEAVDLWRRLEDCADEDRWYLVETCREFQHRGLAELLCHESEEAASDRADRARALAQLACRVAQLAPGEGPAKSRLEGYASFFLSNSVRVSGHLLDAREEFLRGLDRWDAGEGTACCLAEWRVLDLEASLLRDERKFAAALRLLAEALMMAPDEAGRILLKRSFVLEQMGDGEQAIAELRKAEPLVNAQQQPRLYFGVRFNLAANLCVLDQFEEAEEMLPEIQALAAVLQLELHSLRVKWLTGRVAAGRSRLEEAGAALDEVRQEFTKRLSPWDCSLVTLELATVQLRQGRAAEVRTLAEELVWVFQAQGIHLEALAALTLFREAAEREAATVGLTSKLVRYLRKAQGDPALRFTE
jgi:tetratricopeptide (TPR) repeat protein